MPFAAVGAITAVAGLGMSAASAAGAFSSKVDPRTATPEELEAARYNQQVFDQGQQWQKQLDPLSWQRLDTALESTVQQANFLKQYQDRLGGLKRELGTLNGQGYYQDAANRAVNEAWNQYPQAQQQLTATAARSGGPGSGQFMSQLGGLAGGMDNAVRSAGVKGRMGYLADYTQRRGQYGQQLDAFGQRLDAFGNTLASYADQAQGLFGDYAGRVQTGAGMLTQGAGQSAAARDARIQAQISNNQAANAAMGQLGGSMISVGMGGLSATGGLGGWASGGGAASAGSNNVGFDPEIARRVQSAGGSKINSLL